MKSAAVAILTYCVTALVIFGDVLAPLFFMTLWSDRLGVPFWQIYALVCTALCATVFLIAKGILRSLPLRTCLFVVLSMVTSTVSIGIHSDIVRREQIAEFGAREVIDNSFFRSIREAPGEFQFFLHSAVLKDCVAYGWSYRTMSFYQLPRRAARNVVPRSWIEACPQLDVAIAETALAVHHISPHKPD